MGRIGEWLGDAFFGVINFFESIRTGRDDDPDVAEFKARQRQLLLAFFLLFAAIAILGVLGSFFTSVETNGGVLSALAMYRDGAGLIVVAAMACIFAFILFCFGRMWWLQRRNSA